ncbi:MAG: AraC family transcriptional regulator [Clostridia bacterium]|nr:AraC family transcriptional regulator [Clostridia bacterium]
MNEIVYAGQHALVSQVSRHTHDHWELIYCTHGSGLLRFSRAALSYQRGDVTVIPPNIEHSNSSEKGMRNIYVEMVAPSFTVTEPTLVRCDDPGLLQAFEGAFRHFHSDGRQRDALLRLYGALISTYLASAWSGASRPAVADEIARTIEINLGNSEFELDTYLRSLPFSDDYLRRLFQRAFGVTPHGFLTDLRLSRAAELLAGSDRSSVSVIDIARSCGYRDALYFSRIFKKKYGVPPSRYRG